jgi:hypothetical protein
MMLDANSSHVWRHRNDAGDEPRATQAALFARDVFARDTAGLLPLPQATAQDRSADTFPADEIVVVAGISHRCHLAIGNPKNGMTVRAAAPKTEPAANNGEVTSAPPVRSYLFS